MNPEGLEQCRAVLRGLSSSNKHKNDYYIFAEPFNLAETPGYLDVCPKVMDLRTLSENLEQGVYSTKEQFYEDAALTFQNAIAYHSKKQSSWIADSGKKMLKLLDKERAKAEKESAGTDTGSKKSQGGGSKLKLKLGGGKSSSATASVASSSDPPPKPKIKLSTGGSGKQPPIGDLASKKPRLTLKLGKSKAGESPADSAAAAAPAPTTITKISIKASAASRGKELPKGVTAPPSKEKKKSGLKKGSIKKAGATKAKVKIDSSLLKKTKITAGSNSAKPSAGFSLPSASAAAASSTAAAAFGPASLPPTKVASVPMTSARKAECTKVILGLKRRKSKAIFWFLNPVTDPNIIDDYRSKVQNPMDLSTIQSKLDRNEYKTVGSFVLDLRRIVANCLIYNTSIKDSLRPIAVEVLEEMERLCSFFVAKPELPKTAYPDLIFCWKLCLSVIDTLYNLTNNKGDGGMTAYYFLYPVTMYCGGVYPEGYLDKVSKPMDFGTVTANLIEGVYNTLDEFASDCRLILDNCIAFYGDSDLGREFVEQATRLRSVLNQQLNRLGQYVNSSAGAKLQKSAQVAASTIVLSKPPPELLQETIEELRSMSYTDKSSKYSTPAMVYFENPVPISEYPTYPQFVENPMDVSTIEKKIKRNDYNTPEDFEYDMTLIFNNCIVFNTSRNDDHMVNVGKYCLNKFRKVFGNKMKLVDDPTATISPSPKQLLSSPDVSGTQGAAKKLKMDPGVQKGGKMAPRLSLSLSSDKMAKLKASSTTAAPPPPRPKTKPGQPVPLHIAISQVKQQFPLRRDQKSLQPWEAACSKFFKELLKNKWFDPSKPKFIFHVPVPMLFPDLENAYFAKIKKPMDFTTVECTLLGGNKYAIPDDFVNDVALVFANSIVFNKEGKEIGDPLSSSYYEGSIHLLKYCRWLSLESLTDFIQDSDHVDEPDENGLPPTSWKLTMGNLKKAREEMSSLVLNEPIDRSMDGDRNTWMESECEKLLKSLRHISDQRHMGFFLQPNYPADYETYIAKPMDWETCQKKFRKREYEKIGELVDDLRLIFSNALKYNAAHQGTETVSGKAYEAAKYMSTKLETAINKMLLIASDRLERERIDQAAEERERAAQEKAEEERIRAQWTKDASNKEGSSGPGVAPGSAPLVRAQSIGSEKIRSRKPSRRMMDADFDVPFFEDDDEEEHQGGESSSYADVIKVQKGMFEKQRQDLNKMQQLSASLGASVFLRMQQHDLATKWVLEEFKKKVGTTGSLTEKEDEKSDSNDNKTAAGSMDAASSVLPKLEAAGRASIKLSLAIPKPKAKTNKTKKPALSLE